MSLNKVNINGIDTNKLVVLKMKDMIPLFELYKQGDLNAKEKIINGNLKLVLSIVNNYNSEKYDINDLFQVGCIGLVKAVDNFDLSVGVMFSTYAVPLILGEIKRYIRDLSLVRITRSIKDLAYHIIKFQEDYSIKYGENPSLAEILKNFNINEFEYNEAMNSLNKTVSIYEPIYNDGGDTIYIIDQISDKNLDKDQLINLKDALLKIKERERNILIDRYIIGKTQVELAEELHVSQAQISRIETSALNNVKKLMN